MVPSLSSPQTDSEPTALTGYFRIPAWGPLPTGTPQSLLRDLPIVFAGLVLFYGLVSLARYWASPVATHPEIQLDLGALPKYAVFSVVRITVAYFVSLAITLLYGYIAAHNAKAERLHDPTSRHAAVHPGTEFPSGVMVAMVALFPTRQLGVELGAILLIVTGQVWNMTFSVYSSIKSIPREMLEAAAIYRLAGGKNSCKWNCHTQPSGSFGIP